MKNIPSNYTLDAKRYSLVIGWLYPELMNIYGDRGNIISLTKRCEWRGIKIEVKHLNPGFNDEQLAMCNLLMMGGAQDQQQTIVNQDLKKHRKTLSEMIENDIPGLYVCGGFQFLGNYYREADGTIIDGLGIFDLYTENPGEDGERLIGNIAVQPLFELNHKSSIINHQSSVIVGFENHGGRTYLGKNLKPFGKVLKGHGNNDDGTEGAKYKNSFGIYVHGPILPKNPHFADYLIHLSLERKYGKIELKILDDSLEWQSQNSVLDKI